MLRYIDNPKEANKPGPEASPEESGMRWPWGQPSPRAWNMQTALLFPGGCMGQLPPLLAQALPIKPGGIQSLPLNKLPCFLANSPPDTKTLLLQTQQERAIFFCKLSD